jgi:hypothetical protein
MAKRKSERNEKRHRHRRTGQVLQDERTEGSLRIVN